MLYRKHTLNPLWVIGTAKKAVHLCKEWNTPFFSINTHFFSNVAVKLQQ
jgi:hypothetical protein